MTLNQCGYYWAFNNMRTLTEFKVQPTNAFFAIVNQMFEFCASDFCRARGNQIVEHSSDKGTVLGSSRKLGGAAEHLIDGSICLLSFLFWSPHVTESRRKAIFCTWLFTISSARTESLLQPPPMRNEMVLPTIAKQGDVRVPKAASPWILPAGSSGEGRISAPPIHQSPSCLAVSLLRAVGLSPKVGWLSKAVPVFSQAPIPSSKSKLQAV